MSTNEALDNSKPLFTVCCRGKRYNNCSESWHTPDIMDGGYYADYIVKDNICTVSFSTDNFWGTNLLERKSFKVEKCKEYKIFIKDNHIIVPDVELKTIWDKDIAEAEQIKYEKEQEKYRRAHPHEFVDLGNGKFVKKLRLVTTDNLVSVRDQIFSEYAMSTSKE